MRIIKIEPGANGSHRNQTVNGDAPLLEGWAIIPEDMEIPATFPFVDITVEDVTYYRDVAVSRDVTKTREVESVDEEGNPVVVTEEYTETEMVIEKEPYTALTVTSMQPGVMPEPSPKPAPSPAQQLRADVDFLAVMTGVSL